MRNDTIEDPVKEENAAGETAADADINRDESPEKSVEPDALAAARREIDELKSKLNQVTSHEQRVMVAEREVAEREATVNAVAAELKEAKKAFDDAVASLRAEIRRRDDQPTLPFPEEGGGPSPGDELAAMPNSELEKALKNAANEFFSAFDETPLSQIGLTPSVCEKLAGFDPRIETVGQLEKQMRTETGLRPGLIKGIGETAIDKIVDKLREFRAAHPAVEAPAVPLVAGEHDAAQFAAGKIAHADGKLLRDNPNPAGSHAAKSWDAGWQSKADETSEPVDTDAETAIATCERIYELCSTICEDGKEFATGVRNTAHEIHDWIIAENHVTPDQAAALENMITELEAWRHE